MERASTTTGNGTVPGRSDSNHISSGSSRVGLDAANGVVETSIATYPGFEESIDTRNTERLEPIRERFRR
jgi:hypothetical protein